MFFLWIHSFQKNVFLYFFIHHHHSIPARPVKSDTNGIQSNLTEDCKDFCTAGVWPSESVLDRRWTGLSAPGGDHVKTITLSHLHHHNTNTNTLTITTRQKDTNEDEERSIVPSTNSRKSYHFSVNLSLSQYYLILTKWYSDWIVKSCYRIQMSCHA